MNKEKLIIPVAIVLGCLILGVSMYSIQANKQASIDMQFSAKQLEKVQNKILLEGCINQADADYWTEMELNGTKNENGAITAQMRFWDSAGKTKQTTIENCYKQFK